MGQPPSLEKVTFTGCCPACGMGSLFASIIAMHDSCTSCGLAISKREQGDGPAFFALTIIGALATIGAALIEIIYTPPYWLHAFLWVPFIIIGSLVMLRFAKACMVGLQYQANPEDFK